MKRRIDKDDRNGCYRVAGDPQPRAYGSREDAERRVEALHAGDVLREPSSTRRGR